MSASRARFLWSARTTRQGPSLWLVWRNMSSRAFVYATHFLSAWASTGEFFQVFNGSLSRSLSRFFCSSREMSK